MPQAQLQAVLTRLAGSSVALVLALAGAAAVLGGCGAGPTARTAGATGATAVATRTSRARSATVLRPAPQPVPFHGETVDGYRFVYRPIVVAPGGYGKASPTGDAHVGYTVYFRLNKLLPKRHPHDSNTFGDAYVGHAEPTSDTVREDVHRKPCYTQEVDLLHGETPPSRHQAGDLVRLAVYVGNHRQPLSARVPLGQPQDSVDYLGGIYPDERYVRQLGCTEITPGVSPQYAP